MTRARGFLEAGGPPGDQPSRRLACWWRRPSANVGDGAPELLPLKDDDLIVVNGSRNALANKAASARVPRAWRENLRTVVSADA